MPNTNMTITTRFAPSPTGFLHIGGARTALFNWLFAQHNGGQFLLRVEDTDTKRSTAAAISEIIEGLKWLGLAWNGDIVYQSKNRTKHREVANKLLENGLAYKCFSTPEELSEMRLRAREEGKQPRYDGRWRDKEPDDWPSDILPCIRFKSPGDGVSLIQDEVQGEIQIKSSQLDDMVLLRSDGTPTYILAAVVDDHNMGVTHIIRGDDHLVNAVRQSHLYKAMNWAEPIYAHIPLIHGADGSKLSKRHGAVDIREFKEKGYLQEAIINNLILLGWAPSNDNELISLKEIINNFEIKKLSKSSSIFNYDKLNHFNCYYLRKDENSNYFNDYSQTNPQLKIFYKKDKEKLKRIFDIYKKKINYYKELENICPIYFEENFVSKTNISLNKNFNELLTKFIILLENLDLWKNKQIEDLIKNFIKTNKIKFSSFGKPLRLVLINLEKGPSVSDIFFVLGKKNSILRLNNYIKD